MATPARRSASSSRSRAVALAGLAAALAAAAARAEDTVATAPVPDWVVPVAADLPDAAAHQGNVRYLLADHQLRLGRDGDEQYVDTVARIEAPAGLAEVGTLTLPWNPATMSLVVHKLQVKRGTQLIDVLANQSFLVARREQKLEYAMVDGVLTAAIQPAGLQVGDVIELAYTIRHHDPVLAGTSEWLAGGFPGGPLDHLHLRATWDASLPVRWRQNALLPPLEQRRAGAQAEATLDLRDLPMPVQPKAAPGRYALVREVQFTAFRSWAEVSRRLAPLYEKAAVLAADSPLRAEIARIGAATPDPVARAEAALALVEEQVRYVYIGMNDGALVPAAADDTWTRRFGDCKAKTALLLALLRGLGIEAQPVLVNTLRGDGMDANLPMVGWFDHVLVRAQAGGRSWWLDGTRLGDQHLANIPGPAFRWGLPLLPAGSELLAVPPQPLERPETIESIRIDASAGIHVPAPTHVEVAVHGDAALALDQLLRAAPAADLERELKEFWKQRYDFIDVESTHQEFDAGDATARWSMDGKARMDWSGGSYEADGLHAGFRADLERQPGTGHDAPYQVAFPAWSRSTEEIVLPHGGEGFRIEGGDVDRTVGGTSYRRKLQIAQGVFHGERELRSVAPEFPYAEGTTVQQALREMAHVVVRVRAPANYAATPGDREALRASTPTSTSEYIARGNQFLDDDAYDKAIADYSKALDIDPKDDTALGDRGLAWFYKGDLARARQDRDDSLAINPRNAVAHRLDGLIDLKARDAKAALAAFTASLEAEPDNTFTLQRRAATYMMLGEADPALADLKRALALDPSAGGARLQMAWAWLAKQDRVQAAAVIEQGLEAAGTDRASLLLPASQLLSAAGKPERARELLDELLAAKPTAEGYQARARLRPHGDHAGRIDDLQAALRLGPDSQPSRRLLAGEELAAGHYQQAIDDYTALIPATKPPPSLLAERAVAQFKAGRAEAGHKDLAAALAGAKNGHDYNEICWALATAGIELETALSSCDQAVKLSAGQAAYSDSRGFALLRLGRYSEAIEEYDRALKMDPDLSFSLYGRGLARRRTGDTAGGDQDIAAAVQRQPGLADTMRDYGLEP